MIITCTRRLQFCAGHRLLHHEGKCAYLHGHNYVALITAAPEGDLDEVGRVVDFSVLKDRVGGWIEEHWDHGFILNVDDREAIAAVRSINPSEKLYRLNANPTAEHMADFLLEHVGPMVLGATGVRLVKVELWETENCRAEAT